MTSPTLIDGVRRRTSLTIQMLNEEPVLHEGIDACLEVTPTLAPVFSVNLPTQFN